MSGFFFVYCVKYVSIRGLIYHVSHAEFIVKS